MEAADTDARFDGMAVRGQVEQPTPMDAVPFASFVLRAITEANPNASTREPRPYTGAQSVGIPEFQGIGTQVGQTIASTLTG